MKKYKSIIVLIIFAISLTLASCSNMHLGTNMGVDVNFGSNGPHIRPHIGIDLHSGGYY